MKSGKQKRQQMKLARIKRAQKKYLLARGAVREVKLDTVPCNSALLVSNHSCSDPIFVERGYYRDVLFRCKDCNKEEIWTATRQKWWYEIGKGDLWTTAIRCNSCRRKERERKAEARRIHLEGLQKKLNKR